MGEDRTENKRQRAAKVREVDTVQGFRAENGVRVKGHPTDNRKKDNANSKDDPENGDGRDHMNVENFKNDDVFPVNNENSNYSAKKKEAVTSPSKSAGTVPSAVRDTRFSCKESTDYFAHNYHQPNGVAFLISKAFYQGNIDPGDIPKDDVAICLQVVLLVHALSTKQLSLLGSFLENLFR